MRFLKLVLTSLAALTTTVSALPEPARGHPDAVASMLEERGQCLCQADADKLTDAYVRMIRGWNDNDAKYLSDTGFKDTSDSINILAGVPLGSVIFPTKQAFIDHQHEAPDNLPIQITFKTFNCQYITLIWTVTFGRGLPVRGIAILGAVKNGGGKGWQIKSIDVEFNSMAFLHNIGGSYTFPPRP